MGTPSTTTERPTVGLDPLAEIGSVLTALMERDVRAAEDTEHLLEGRQEFLDVFRRLCDTEVRPAMQAVLDRLRQQGGDGLIEEHPGGEPRVSTPRLTLWMSLQGPIAGAPRLDRNPYLQLDADVAEQMIRLTEGDSWRGGGAGHSGSSGAWKPAEVTQALVMQELVDIVRRSARISPSS